MSAWGIVGDGQWAIALSRRLIKHGHSVRMVGLKRRRKGIPKGVTHTVNLGAVLEECERVALAVPIGEFEGMLQDAAKYLQAHHRVVSTARGLTPETHLRATEAIREMTAVRQLAVLAGAADADALRRGAPVALVVGTPFPQWAQEIQDSIGSGSLRVYTNPDMVGVELANVVAAVVGVALGIARTMYVGAAAEATALTRALAEMNRVVGGLGGREGTAYGLAGLGVLGEMVYDGSGAAFKAGEALANERLKEACGFAEVREASRTLAARVQKHRISAPLVTAVEQLFTGQLTAVDALSSLMERPMGAED